MLTKISQLFVIHQKTTSFSYIRQAYDPCLQHGDELRSLRSCSTGSPACQGLRPRTPGWKIIAAWLSPVPMFPCLRWHRVLSLPGAPPPDPWLENNCCMLESHAHVPIPVLIPCPC